MCSHFATSSDSGIRRTSVPSCGPCSTLAIAPEKHNRVFPISNWTEMDVWQYILHEDVELPSIYFSHQRKVFERDGMLMADSEYINRREDEEVFEAIVRFRTVGDMSCTGAFESTASSLEDVIAEVSATPDHRARGIPRRRSNRRDSHGRPQAGGVLLNGTDGTRSARNDRLCG